MAPTRKYYLKNNNLTLRSKSNEGHYGMRHTSLWSCTHIPNIIDLQQLFDLEVKGQGPTKVIMVRDTPHYGHAPTYQLSLTYLERQKCYDPDKKIPFKKQSFDLEVKGQGPTKVIMVRDTPPYGHAPTYEVEEKEAEEKIRLKQYVSLRSKGRHNYPFDNGPFDIVCQQAVYNLDLA
jgi:hypothetical protein